MYLQKLNQNKKFSYIIGDVYSDFSIPSHLTTKEFAQLIKNHLEKDGIYAMNIIDTFNPGLLIKSVTHTFNQVFNHTYIFAQQNNNRKSRDTYIVIATDIPLDLEKIKNFQWSKLPDLVKKQNLQNTLKTKIDFRSRLKKLNAKKG